MINNTRVSQFNGRYKKLPLSCLSHFQWFKIEVAWCSNWLKSKNMSFCIRGMLAMNTSSFTNLLVMLSLILRCWKNTQFSHSWHAYVLRFRCTGCLRFRNNNMWARIFMVNLCNVILRKFLKKKKRMECDKNILVNILFTFTHVKIYYTRFY